MGSIPAGVRLGWSQAGIPFPRKAEETEKMENRWLSLSEISAHLGVKEPTLYKWIARKPDIPAHKVGRLWKFKVDEVDAWVRSGGAAPLKPERKRPQG